jgi:hypothetical protein
MRLFVITRYNKSTAHLFISGSLITAGRERRIFIILAASCAVSKGKYKY